MVSYRMTLKTMHQWKSNEKTSFQAPDLTSQQLLISSVQLIVAYYYSIMLLS